MKITNTRLYDHVYSTDEKFIEAAAIEHACANMGMEHLLDDDDSILSVKQQLTEEHYSAYLSEFGYSAKGEAKAEKKAVDSVHAEISSWKEQAAKDLVTIKERGLPLSLRSSRIVFAGGSTYEG